MKIADCIICGKSFVKKTCDKTCCVECRKEKARRNHRRSLALHRETYAKKCPVCFSEFTATDDRRVLCDRCKNSKKYETIESKSKRVKAFNDSIKNADGAYIRELCRRRGLPINEETIGFCRISLLLKRELDKHDDAKSYSYPTLTKTCDVCRKSFKTTSRVKTRCSQECQREAARKNARQRYVYKDRKTSLVCKTCGKLFEHPQLGRPKYYCDHGCRNAYRKMKPKCPKTSVN